MKNGMRSVFAAAVAVVGLSGVSSFGAEPAKEIRIGHFPNITHAQAVLAQAGGEFEKALGVPVKWSLFNAGPSAIEAMFSDAIDVTYIGPNPAINGFIKSEGKVFQILAGSAGGGAALVVRPDSGIAGEKDFDGKIIATPQLGNTQDVAARAWFQKKGYALKEKGGSLTILPLANPDQLMMFQKKEIDGAWTVEPWVSRLEQEGGGKVFLEEKDLWPNGQYVTTHMIVSRKFLAENPELVKKLLRAHIEMTQKLNADKEAAIPVLIEELKKETGKGLSADVIRSAFRRIEFTWDPIQSSLYKSADDAFAAGFLKEKPELAGIYNLSPLNSVLKDMKLKTVEVKK